MRDIPSRVSEGQLPWVQVAIYDQFNSINLYAGINLMGTLGDVAQLPRLYISLLLKCPLLSISLSEVPFSEVFPPKV